MISGNYAFSYDVLEGESLEEHLKNPPYFFKYYRRYTTSTLFRHDTVVEKNPPILVKPRR